MATKLEIERNIDETRAHLDRSLEEINSLIQERMDLKKQIRRHPEMVAFAAGLIGFSLIMLSTKTGRDFLKHSFRPILALGAGYASKKALRVFTGK